MDNQIDLDYLKSVFRRRKNIIIAVFTLVMVTALAIAVLLPPVYRSQVGIMVEGQQIPEDYVQSNITTFVEERIEMITKQVMSRSRLLEIIKKYNLYADLSTRKTEEEIIDEMRGDIELETWTADVGQRNVVTIGFTLSLSGSEQEKLQAVTNELAYLYIEEEHKVKEKMASVTTNFLQQELDSFKAHISELEHKISVFKQLHIGELPENYSGNSQALERLERRNTDIEREIRSLEERKLYIKSQLSGVEPMTPIMVDGENVMMNPAERLKRLRLELISLQSAYSEKHPDIMKLKKEINELEGKVGGQDDSEFMARKLSDLKGELAAARARLGDKHPDVIKMQKELDALSTEVETLKSRKLATEALPTTPDNPIYINLMTQIATIDSQIAGYREEQMQTKKSIVDYSKRLENAPAVEKEYLDLTRDLNTTMKKYNDLLGDLMQAKVSEGMESSQRGERLSISEPASYPEKPYKPNRKLIIIIGFLVAITATIGVVTLIEASDISLKTPKEVSMYTGLPVFSIFPMIQTDEEKRNAKKRIYWYAGAVIVLMVILLIVINQAVMPLDVILSKITGRMTEIGMPLDAASTNK